MRTDLVFSALALAALAGAANAATFSITSNVGAYNGQSGGSADALAIGSTWGTNFSFGTGTNSLRGTINSANVISTGSSGQNQVFTLVFTDFSFKSDTEQSAEILVSITQDYVIAAGAGNPATGSHQINGMGFFSTLGQNVQGSVASQHESTVLAPLNFNLTAGGFSQLINDAEPTVAVPHAGGIYTITTQYRFVVSANGQGVTEIFMPDSGVDNSFLTMVVPLPPAAYAGLATLALAGFAAIRRRVQNRA